MYFSFIFFNFFGEIMYFNLKNKIFLHKIFIFLPLLFFMGSGFLHYISTLFFAFLHESAHLSAALLLGEKVKRVFIMPYGFELRINMPQMKNELLISIAGPLFSLIAAIIFFIIPQKEFFCTNFFLFLLNLIPAIPLDGGRILKFFLWRKIGALNGNDILKRVSLCFAVIFFALSLVTLNLWLLVISITITLRCHTLCASPFYKKRVYPTPTKIFVCKKNKPLTKLLRFFSPYYETAFITPFSEKIIYEKEIISLLLFHSRATLFDLLPAKPPG